MALNYYATKPYAVNITLIHSMLYNIYVWSFSPIMKHIKHNGYLLDKFLNQLEITHYFM